MTDEEFTQHALEVLQRELGPDGLARFLRLTCSGSRLNANYLFPGERFRHRFDI